MIPLVMTECYNLVPANRVCFGKKDVPKEWCEKCSIYAEKKPHNFNTKRLGKTGKKGVSVKVHAFGVTVTATPL